MSLAATIDARRQMRFVELVTRLIELPSETEWVEFKINQFDPETLGRTISALANGARLRDQENAYLVFGVQDVTHEIVGTKVEPGRKIAGQPAEMWLSQRLAPAPVLHFYAGRVEGFSVTVLEISAATELPVTFDRISYIRIGSATPPLRDYPEIEKKLNVKLRPFVWETGIASGGVTLSQTVELIDIDAFFTLRELPRPVDASIAAERLVDAGIIQKDGSEYFDITNGGALLLARDLTDFPLLSRKALRIIHYNGRNRSEAKPEQFWLQGYASGFTEILKFLQGILPAREVIGASRVSDRVYPLEAIKELLANTLIHQDMTTTGTGPKIEVFSDRIEFTNPGEPVTDWKKLFGAEPRSRNERIADTMRKFSLCEERGLGLRRTIRSTTRVGLIPPEFKADSGSSKVILHGHSRSFAAMDTSTRNRAIYYLSMILNEDGERLTNSALRQRYPMGGNDTVKASSALRVCVDVGFIKVADPQRPNSGYVPFWA